MSAREKFSILLVDDDRTVIHVLRHMLDGFEPVRFATSGRQALKVARESVPDLVLMDVDMPELSGFEVCKQFKSDPTLAQVPIIMITSHVSPQLEVVGMQLGAADFISKPPRASLVLARVRTYQRLKMLADTLRGALTLDILTGAITRRQLDKALRQELQRARRSGAPLALLLVDIDGFTAYNAEFGEEQGNACLRRVADALRAAGHRPADVLGRYAGGQFALLLPETDALGAASVTQHAIDAVDALQIAHAASTGMRCITLSVGGACREQVRSIATDPGVEHQMPPDDAPAADFIKAAEQALRRARLAGGHQARFADKTTDARVA